MVEQQPSKLNTRVRFPSPAPAISSTFNIPKFHSDKGSAAHSARGGVTRFQHPWKINSGSYSGHICARPRAAEMLLVENLKLLITGSCYEYHPPGISKTERRAVGRQVLPNGSERDQKARG